VGEHTHSEPVQAGRYFFMLNIDVWH